MGREASWAVIAILLVGMAFCASVWIKRDTAASGTVQGGPAEITVVHLSTLYIACEEYRKAKGQWPSNLAAAVSFMRLKDTNVVSDGWGRPILWLPSTNSPGTMLLMSYGPDGLPGGLGTNGDVVYTLR